MYLFRVQKHISDMKRLKEIVGVLFELGLDVVLSSVRLNYLIPWRSRIRRLCGFYEGDIQQTKKMLRRRKRSYPEQIRLVCERLGPTFVKLGQILSLRNDLLPEEYTLELEKLQDAVAPFPFQEVQKILEEEYHRPVHEVFKRIQQRPVASASLSQVHIAYLKKNNKKVALKVQRPGIQEVVKRDLNILTFIARRMEKHSTEFERLHPTRVISEFTEWTLRELDFLCEAGHMLRLQYVLRDVEDVVIPRVYQELTTSRVLVMEYIKGIKGNDMKMMKQAQIHPKEIAALCVRATLQQILIEGFFHADPHPGNFAALPGGKLVLYDFGMVGYLEPTVRRELSHCLFCFLEKNPEGYVRHILHLVEVSESSDILGFSRGVMTLLNQWMYSEKPQKNIAKSFHRVVSLSTRYDVTFHSDLVLFARVLMMLESIAKKLDPRFEIHQAIQPFIKEMQRSMLRPKRNTFKVLQTEFFDSVEIIKHLPEQTSRILKKLEHGEIGVRVNPSELTDLKEEFDRQNDIRVLAILGVALFIGSSVVMRLEKHDLFESVSLGQIGLVISGLLFLWLLILVRQKH